MEEISGVKDKSVSLYLYKQKKPTDKKYWMQSKRCPTQANNMS